MYYVYVLQSITGDLYKGITKDIEARVSQHNAGQSRWTRGKGPWTLVYFEECLSRGEARVREKYLKSGVGREFLKSYLAGCVVK